MFDLSLLGDLCVGQHFGGLATLDEHVFLFAVSHIQMRSSLRRGYYFKMAPNIAQLLP